jgi:hypothetical protein
MYTRILKLVYIYSDLLHVSANHVAIFRKVTFCSIFILFYLPEDGQMVGRNM